MYAVSIWITNNTIVKVSGLAVASGEDEGGNIKGIENIK